MCSLRLLRCLAHSLAERLINPGLPLNPPSARSTRTPQAEYVQLMIFDISSRPCRLDRRRQCIILSTVCATPINSIARARAANFKAPVALSRYAIKKSTARIEGVMNLSDPSDFRSRQKLFVPGVKCNRAAIFGRVRSRGDFAT